MPQTPDWRGAMRLLLAASRVAISKTTARNDGLKRLLRVGLFSAMLFTFNAHAQTHTPCPPGLAAETVCYSVQYGNGAVYVTATPENWNDRLAVHAHGGPPLGGAEQISPSLAY